MSKTGRRQHPPRPAFRYSPISRLICSRPFASPLTVFYAKLKTRIKLVALAIDRFPRTVNT